MEKNKNKNKLNKEIIREDRNLSKQLDEDDLLILIKVMTLHRFLERISINMLIAQPKEDTKQYMKIFCLGILINT